MLQLISLIKIESTNWSSCRSGRRQSILTGEAPSRPVSVTRAEWSVESLLAIERDQVEPVCLPPKASGCMSKIMQHHDSRVPLETARPWWWRRKPRLENASATVHVDPARVFPSHAATSSENQQSIWLLLRCLPKAGNDKIALPTGSPIGRPTYSVKLPRQRMLRLFM